MPSKSDRMRLNPPGHPALPVVDSLRPRSSVWDGIGFLALAEVPGRLSSPSPALPVAGHPLSPRQRALLTPLLPRPSLPQTVPSQGTVSLLLPIAPPPCVNSPLDFNCLPSPPTPDICTDYTLSWCPGLPVLGWSGAGWGGGGRLAGRNNSLSALRIWPGCHFLQRTILLLPPNLGSESPSPHPRLGIFPYWSTFC